MRADASSASPPSSQSPAGISPASPQSPEKAMPYVRRDPSQEGSDQTSAPRLTRPERTFSWSAHMLQQPRQHQDSPPRPETHSREAQELSKASPRSPSDSCCQDLLEAHAVRPRRRKTFGPTAVMF